MRPPEFLPWTEPVLPAAARLLARRHDRDGVLDLDGVLVVVPIRRAGRRLTELLLEEASERGLVLVPPDVVTTGGFPERLRRARPDRPVAGDVLCMRAWAEALRDLDADRRSLVFPEPPAADDLPGWHELARLVRDLHRELAGEKLGFEDVASVCRDGPGYDDSDRWRALAEARRGYERRLDALGYVDRDGERWDAIRDERVESTGPIYLLGVVEMPKVVRRTLEALGDDVTPLVHAPPDGRDAFDELGCVRPEAWAARPIRIPDDTLEVAGRPPEQADAVLRRLGGAGPRLAPDHVTVGVPDTDLVPYLERRLGEHGVPHRHAEGTPLERTDPWRLLSAVADHLEGERWPDFAALLRHPAVEAAPGLPGALETADEHFGRHLPSRVEGPARGSAGGGDFGRLVGDLEEELALGRLRGARPLSEWMAEILAFLVRAYGGRPLDRSRAGDRRLVEACETIRDRAAAWSRLAGTPLDRECGASAALRLLLEEVRREAVPPLPDTSAVELLGWLELHLDDAPVLVLTGLDEAHVPGSVSADLFLPDGLRSRLGLVDDAHRLGRDAYLLSAMLAPREEAHLVVGRRSAEGDPLRPSRLLLALEGPDLARRVLRMFGQEEERAPRLARPGIEPADRSSFRTPPDPVLRIAEPPPTLRVTSFGLLLGRPYQFVLGRILELEAVDDRAREMDGLAFGELAHAVLRTFGEGELARSDDPDAIRAGLGALLDRAAERRFGDRALPAVRLQVEQLRIRLGAFAEWHAARVRGGWETVAVEVGTPDEGTPFVVDGEPIGLTGRIDRIDRHAESGAWAVLDYKTSAKSREPEKTHRARDGSWTDLQLPLYRHILPDLARTGALPPAIADPGARVGLGYVNLSREGAALALAPWDETELASAYEAARSCVRLLRQGEIAWREEETVDRYSPFATLLGRGRLVSAGDGDGEEDG